MFLKLNLFPSVSWSQTQSVRLLGWEIARPLPTQRISRKWINTYMHPCFWWVSNPWPYKFLSDSALDRVATFNDFVFEIIRYMLDREVPVRGSVMRHEETAHVPDLMYNVLHNLGWKQKGFGAKCIWHLNNTKSFLCFPRGKEIWLMGAIEVCRWWIMECLWHVNS
jgi:hypothetical protein